MEVEITKSDLKTIVSKASRDNKFNAIKNALAKDIPSYLRKENILVGAQLMKGNMGNVLTLPILAENLE